jgi:glycosyltransferase involved in cell wall biosynthesis
MLNANSQKQTKLDHLIIVTSSYAYVPDDAHINSGVFVRDFARAIAEQGIHVTVVTQQRTQPVREDPGVRVIAYPWSGMDRQPVELSVKRMGDIRHILSLLRAGGKALRNTSPQDHAARCLCMWAVPAGYMAMKVLRGTGIEYDVWCLGSDIWHYGGKWYSKWLIKKVLKKAQYLFADGYTLKEDVRTLAGRNCTFLASSRMLPRETKVVPQCFRDRPNLLFIGRWHPNKGVDLLPETMRLLAQTNVKAHLHIFGGGALENELMRRIAEHDVEECITVHGYADAHTAVAYLRACDALIIPSRIESIPIIFSDAVKCGIPIVATAVGDVGTLVRKYDIGEVVQPESPSMLADGIRHILIKDRSLFSRGIHQAAQIFDVRASALQYIQTSTAGSQE